MTVFLVLLFLIIALGMDALVTRRRAKRMRKAGANGIIRHLNGTVQEIFEHGDGVCPTMADGGEKVK